MLVESPGHHDRVLQKVSSILLNSPATHEGAPRNAHAAQNNMTFERKKGVAKVEDEIIPDSEEEQVRPYTSNKIKYPIIDPNIIEISSEEEEDIRNISNSPPKDLSPANIPGAGPANDLESDSQAEHKETRQLWFHRSPITPPKSKRYNRTRRIIESSSSDSGDSENVAEKKGSSPKEFTVHKKISIPEVPKKLGLVITEVWDAHVPLSVDPDDVCDDNSAILTLNEPKDARKPTHYKSLGSWKPQNDPPSEIGTLAPNLERSLAPIDTSSRLQATEGPILQSSISPRKTRQPPRSTKKATAAAEQAKREVYAQSLFTELNRVVFKDGLPKDTKLNWNKRLLTTAGRARWHRSRDGTQTTEIELAEKILDCEERIRNTLSHEMCHLASWLIDDEPNEVHGRLWKAWATRVMRKRPEIEITTRHDYEISYPYEWECERCAKIYGRFSKSIRTDECVCGSCKVGKLNPLFLTPSRVSKTPKISRMSAMKPQDSPSSVLQPSLTPHGKADKNDVIPSLRKLMKVYIIPDSDSELDPDIQELTTTMASVAINSRVI